MAMQDDESFLEKIGLSVKCPVERKAIRDLLLARIRDIRSDAMDVYYKEGRKARARGMRDVADELSSIAKEFR